jgi:hypothetical protein
VPRRGWRNIANALKMPAGGILSVMAWYVDHRRSDTIQSRRFLGEPVSRMKYVCNKPDYIFIALSA